ncbi:DUF1732 domain-containing protein [bacterium]|nr:DUF1732 domain-containing protein [bacterium]
MICSMTGFGAQKSVNNEFELVMEIKSYNAKGCEPHIKLSHEIAYMEQKIRRMLSTYVKRGKVYLYIKYINLREKKGKVIINNSIIPEIQKSISILESKLKHKIDFSYRDALSIPDFLNVVYDSNDKTCKDAKEVLDSFTEVMGDFLFSQEKEGRELRKDLEKRYKLMVKACEKIEKLGNKSVKSRRDKIKKMMSKILDDEKISQDRVENELAIQLNKLDITEELVRLKCHFKQLRALLDTNKSKSTTRKDAVSRSKSYKTVGLQIDFICQEILREANTINSKSDDIQIIKSSLVIKTEITKLREQGRNIK